MSKKRRVKPARLANRTIWALEDLTSEALSLRALLQKAIARAEKTEDVPLLLLLSKINNHAVNIHAKAVEARRGEYNE